MTAVSQQAFELSMASMLASAAAKIAKDKQKAQQQRIDVLADAVESSRQLEAVLGDFAMRQAGCPLPVALPASVDAAAVKHKRTKREAKEQKPQEAKPVYRARYDVDQLKDCMQRIGDGAPLASTAQAMNIPRQTVADVKQRGYIAERMGKKPHLEDEDEERIMKWIVASSRCGMTQPLINILEVAGRIAEKRGEPFKNGNPTEMWWRRFKRRALAKGCACDLVVAPPLNPCVADVLKAKSLQACDPAELRDATSSNVLGFFSRLSNTAGTFRIPAKRWCARTCCGAA